SLSNGGKKSRSIRGLSVAATAGMRAGLWADERSARATGEHVALLEVMIAKASPLRCAEDFFRKVGRGKNCVESRCFSGDVERQMSPFRRDGHGDLGRFLHGDLPHGSCSLDAVDYRFCYGSNHRRSYNSLKSLRANS